MDLGRHHVTRKLLLKVRKKLLLLHARLLLAGVLAGEEDVGDGLGQSFDHGLPVLVRAGVEGFALVRFLQYVDRVFAGTAAFDVFNERNLGQTIAVLRSELASQNAKMEAVLALHTLGVKDPAAEKAVAKAYENLGDSADAAALIPEALKYL